MRDTTTTHYSQCSVVNRSETGLSLLVVGQLTQRDAGGQAQVLLNHIDLVLNVALDGVEQVVKDLDTRLGQLLQGEASNGNHRQAAVVQLLGLQLLQLVLVLGAQAQGVEVQVAQVVLLLQGVEGLASGGGPAQGDAVRLGQANGNQERLVEARLELLELHDGLAVDLAIKVVEQGVVLQLLANDEAQSSQHRHTAVGQLRLTPAAHILEGGRLGDAEGVPHALEGARLHAAAGQSLQVGSHLLLAARCRASGLAASSRARGDRAAGGRSLGRDAGADHVEGHGRKRLVRVDREDV
mmetsp:Transcript_61656/g.135067  ORF Transcript_61656/g.135067 Transcript_61656/m.135067 type:complete len:296 (+) Transcript_61656:292-1179(+)